MALTAEYKTTDIFIASFLIAIGYEKYRLLRQGRQVTFIFQENPNIGSSIQSLIDKYYSNDFQVEPKLLFNAYRELKARIFDGI